MDLEIFDSWPLFFFIQVQQVLALPAPPVDLQRLEEAKFVKRVQADTSKLVKKAMGRGVA